MDSVSVFSEGTFEEQILELVTYIAQNLSEDERTTFIQPFQDSLKTDEGKTPLSEDSTRQKEIFSKVLTEVKDLGSGSSKEIEGFFNLVYSHLLSLYSLDSSEAEDATSSLVKTIASSSSENTVIKYRIISNLFNALPRRSRIRLSVYTTLLDTAIENKEFTLVQPTQLEVEKWLAEWEITDDQKSALLRKLTDAHAKSSQSDASYKFLLSYVRSLSSSSSSYQSAAVEAIATALRSPSIFDFDPLYKLDAVVAAKDHELFPLLRIFTNEGLPEFQSWESSHGSILSKYELNKADLEHKIRLLTLSSLGFANIGKDLPYAKVAEALAVDVDQVEKWVIDVIRTGLVSGKLSQTTQTVHVTRSTARAFEREQWQALEQRLVAWKAGLADVLEVCAAARRQNAPNHVSVQTQTATA